MKKAEKKEDREKPVIKQGLMDEEHGRGGRLVTEVARRGQKLKKGRQGGNSK